MTKIDGRTKEVAERQIETCLERLQTDHIDLVQHHEIIRFDDPDRIFAESGAHGGCAGCARKRVRFATSDSPVTKIRTFICTC